MTKLEDIREYLSKMTPGEWRIDHRYFAVVTKDGVVVDAEFTRLEDADGMARLHNDAEYLLTRCERLEKALTSIIHGAMATEADEPCSICRPGYDHRHETGCPILEAESLLREGQ